MLRLGVETGFDLAKATVKDTICEVECRSTGIKILSKARSERVLLFSPVKFITLDHVTVFSIVDGIVPCRRHLGLDGQSILKTKFSKRSMNTRREVLQKWQKRDVRTQKTLHEIV